MQWAPGGCSLARTPRISRAVVTTRSLRRRREPCWIWGSARRTRASLSGRICRGCSRGKIDLMELAIQIQIEELPEGLFLATSEELPGLVPQGRTVAEALEIARDVARKQIGRAS